MIRNFVWNLSMLTYRDLHICCHIYFIKCVPQFINPFSYGWAFVLFPLFHNTNHIAMNILHVSPRGVAGCLSLFMFTCCHLPVSEGLAASFCYSTSRLMLPIVRLWNLCHSGGGQWSLIRIFNLCVSDQWGWNISIIWLVVWVSCPVNCLCIPSHVSLGCLCGSYWFVGVLILGLLLLPSASWWPVFSLYWWSFLRHKDFTL